MWVLETLEHIELVEDHAFIALDIFLQNNLDRDFPVGTVCFADNAIGARTQGSTKPIPCLPLVALRLALKAIEHGIDYVWANRSAAFEEMGTMRETAVARDKERNIRMTMSVGLVLESKKTTGHGIDLQLIATWDALQRKVEVMGDMTGTVTCGAVRRVFGKHQTEENNI